MLTSSLLTQTDTNRDTWPNTCASVVQTKLKPEQATALYRHFSVSGELLYVGISNSPAKRWSQHTGSAHWTFSVAYVTIQWFDNRKSALIAEQRAIGGENPINNKQRPSLGIVGKDGLITNNSAHRMAEMRKRKSLAGLIEVRGIFAHPDDHAVIKTSAADISAKRSK